MIPAADGIPTEGLPNWPLHAEEPNRVWVAQSAYVRTWAGWVYVVFIVDVRSRTVDA